MHRKIFVPVLAALLCITVFAVSASADTWNLDQFVESSSFDGSSYTHRFRFIANDLGVFHLTSGSKPQINLTGKSFSFNIGMFNLAIDDLMSMVYYPFGEDNYFTIGSSSSDSVCLCSGGLKWNQTNRTSGLSSVVGAERVRIFFYDQFHNYISVWEGDPDVDTLSVPQNAAFFNIQFRAEFLITAENVSCTMDDIILTNIVSASASIEDSILGPGGDPILPDSGDMQGVSDLEDGLLSDSSSVISDIKSFGDSALSFVSGLSSGFAFVQFLVADASKELPFLPALLYISLSIGIFASIVGIVGIFFRKGGD